MKMPKDGTGPAEEFLPGRCLVGKEGETKTKKSQERIDFLRDKC